MVLRMLLVLSFTSMTWADWSLSHVFQKGVDLAKSSLPRITAQPQTVKPPIEPQKDQFVPKKLFQYSTGVAYTPNNIDGIAGKGFRVEQDRLGHPVLFCKYQLDDQVTLQYVLMPQAYLKKRYQFPQDFMVEIPSFWLKQHKLKSLQQIAFLGTHNCFANPVDGFLYFQQQDSIQHQFERGGVRMFRPAWHNPSGSIVDAPNLEPILCHADDDKCATASLATRGFRPHKIVKEFNQLLVKLLEKYPDEVVIVCINNYLTSAKTEKEIEKVPHLAKMVLTLDDLNNKKYQQSWDGHSWPTLDWMLQHDKRVIFISDESTRYTIGYEKYIRRNQYGTSSIAQASKSRLDTKSNGNELVELSWFQNVSLPLHEINALQVGVELYWKVMTAVPAVFAQALHMPQEFFGYQHLANQKYTRELQKFIDVVSFVHNKAKLLFSKGVPYKLIREVQEKFPALKRAVKKIEKYVPVKQDNSLETLSRLVQACRSTGVLSLRQIPNIVMLDFATTTGDGIVFVNLVNMLMDQKLKLQFVDVGGFCYHGKQIATRGIV